MERENRELKAKISQLENKNRLLMMKNKAQRLIIYQYEAERVEIVTNNIRVNEEKRKLYENLESFVRIFRACESQKFSFRVTFMNLR
jgi:hypothetical protein